MFHALPYKTKQFFFVLIKLSIVFGAFYFIYQKLTEHKDLDFDIFYQFLKDNNTFSTKNISILLLLSCCNWLFEIIKWQKLVSSIASISFYEALKQSLASLTASLITPNRIGEYGAKAVYFSKANRKKALLLNLIGNMSQMGATVLFGCIGLLFLYQHYTIEIDYFKVLKIAFVIVAISTLTIIGITQKKYKIRGFSLIKVRQFWNSISTSIKVTTLVLACVRYLIFSFQFYYLLLAFGIEVSYLRAMMVITSMYLLASIIPTLSVFDVVIKGSVAVYLFNIVDVNEISVVCIILLMWILNTVIPSIIGSYYVINFNFKQEGAE